MATTQNILSLVNQLHNMELSFTNVLMETVMKFSSLSNASVFLLVETQEGRRFSGKRQLCDAYIRGELTPMDKDVELEINPSICALEERQVLTPNNFQHIFTPKNGLQASHLQTPFSMPSPFSTPSTANPRKRPHPQAPPVFGQVKTLRESPKTYAKGAGKNEPLKDVVKEEVDIKPIITESQGKEQNDSICVTSIDYNDVEIDSDGDSDVAIIIEEHPSDAGEAVQGHFFVNTSLSDLNDRSSLEDNSCDNTLSDMSTTLVISDYQPSMLSPFNKLQHKLTALESFTIPELTGDHPVASKLFKSCLYDFAKNCGSDYARILNNNNSKYFPSAAHSYIRQKFQDWIRGQPLVHSIYSSGAKLTSKNATGTSVSSDSTMWNYVRNAFNINVKRQIKSELKCVYN